MTTPARHPQDEAALPPRDLDALTMLLLADLEPVPPSPDARQRLLADTTPRLARFASRLASLIDITVDRARDLLERALGGSGWEPLPIPGATTLWVDGGPAAANCIRGFVRLPAGTEFPPHTHLGDEQVLVLDGAILDSSGREYLPGDVATMPSGTTHSYRARDGGTDLLIFAVVAEGLEIAGTPYRHRDG